MALDAFKDGAFIVTSQIYPLHFSSLIFGNLNRKSQTSKDTAALLCWHNMELSLHYNDATMSAMASQITSLTIVYSTVYSGADQRKHQTSASLAFVWGIHRGPDKWPVTRRMFPFDDVIMDWLVHIPPHLARIFFFRNFPSASTSSTITRQDYVWERRVQLL